MSSILKVDTINEVTSANGVTVDGLSIKDSKLVTADSVVTANITADAVTLAKMAPGTDGNLISYDTSGNPVAVATGNDGQVLTSAGAGAVPTFETLPAGGVDGISSSANATAISIDSSEVVRLPVGVLRLQNATTGTADSDGLLIDVSGNDVYINNKENADMYFRTNNTDRLKLHDNGVLSAANGVALGVGTANTASNVLDDYEEGSFTTTLSSGLGASLNSFNYTKIGNFVILCGKVTINSTDSSSTQVTMTLPFNSDGRNAVTTNFVSGQTTGDIGLVAYSNNSSTIQFYNVNDNANESNHTHANVSSGDEYYLTVTYRSA